MPSPCGIHLFRKTVAVCPVCARVLGELRDTPGIVTMSPAARKVRQEIGQRSRVTRSHFGILKKV